MAIGIGYGGLSAIPRGGSALAVSSVMADACASSGCEARPEGGTEASPRRGGTPFCQLTCEGHETIEKSCPIGTKCEYSCHPTPRITCVRVGPYGW